MQYFRTNVKVGLFILCSLVLFFAAAILVGRADRWFASKHHYLVLFPNANLLRLHAKVSYSGYVVGEVTAIEIQPDSEQVRRYPGYYVAASIVVPPWVMVRDDARITMRTDGFIGDRYLDITPGQGAIVPPGSMVLGTVGGVEGLMASFAGSGGGFKDITEALRTLLVDTSDARSLPATLESLCQLIDDFRPRLVEVSIALSTLLVQLKDEVNAVRSVAVTSLQTLDTTVTESGEILQGAIAALRTTLGQAQKTLQSAEALLHSSKGGMTKVLTSVHKLSETTRRDTATLLSSVHTLADTLRRDSEATLEQLQHVLTHADALLLHNDGNVYSTVENLRDSTDNLKAATRQLRSNPAVLIWGNGKPHDVDPATGHTAHTLQDRGRVGRYDRVQ